MTTKNYQELVAEFPQLYPHRFGFECGPGWFDLIRDLSKELVEIIQKQDDQDEYPMQAVQVKEKYGTLRFYMSHSTDEMEELIDIATARSAVTCEACGKPGTINDKGWIKVRCDEHKCLKH